MKYWDWITQFRWKDYESKNLGEFGRRVELIWNILNGIWELLGEVFVIFIKWSRKIEKMWEDKHKRRFTRGKNEIKWHLEILFEDWKMRWGLKWLKKDQKWGI